jgi:hypothetical protein
LAGTSASASWVPDAAVGSPPDPGAVSWLPHAADSKAPGYSYDDGTFSNPASRSPAEPFGNASAPEHFPLAADAVNYGGPATDTNYDAPAPAYGRERAGRQRTRGTSRLAPAPAYGRAAAGRQRTGRTSRPARPRVWSRWRKLPVVTGGVGLLLGVGLGRSFFSVIRAIVWFGYHLWNPVLLWVIRAIVSFGYHLWNPVLLWVIRAIVWFGYHLWNPVAVGFWGSVLAALRDLIAPNSMAEYLRSVAAGSTVTFVLYLIHKRRERKQMAAAPRPAERARRPVRSR